MAQERDFRRIIKNNIWIVFSLVHFALSFLYERIIIQFDSSGWDIFWSVAKVDRYSNFFQSAVLYLYGKAIAAVLICILWYVVWQALKGRIPRNILIAFAAIVVVMGFYFYLFLPSSFSWKDSYTLYGFAVRLIPWYWHHYLTSAWYLGCIMVFPHPFMIGAVQFVGFTAVMLYLYYRLKKSFALPKWSNMLIFAIYLAPETFWLIAFAYRNCIYAIILMFYIAFIAMEENDKAKSSCLKLVILCFLSALLSVWRTEGALIGITGILLCLFRIYSLSKKQRFVFLLVFAAFFAVLSAPQKIGDTQYYGKDYFIASTVEPIKNILNDSEANLSYEGAQEDLDSIAELAPLVYFQYDGKNSVNAYFYQNGHVDFDQTLASEDLSGRYLKAFLRLALHNLPTYIKTQLNFAFESLKLPVSFSMEAYEGEAIDIYYEYSVDEYGTLDYMRFATPLISNAVHDKVGSIAAVVTVGYRELNENTGITAIIRMLLLILDIVIFVRELVRIIRRKKDADVVCMCLSGLFLVQFAIVVMTIPMVFDMYFYSIFYPCLVVEIIYLFKAISARRAGGGSRG